MTNRGLRHRGSVVTQEMRAFEADLVSLRPDLPDVVWRDLWRRWSDLRRSLEGKGP